MKTTFLRPALVGLSAALILGACGTEKNDKSKTQAPIARPAKLVQLTQEQVLLRRSYPGTLEASQQANLSFRVSGQLSELPAMAGTRVKAGDLLAKIDPRDYENSLKERQARYDLAKTTAQQTRTLLKKKLTSQIQNDQANAELQSASAALQQARDNLQYTKMTAPFDGIVARVSIENYQQVSANTPIIELRRDDVLDISFSVPETLIAQLKRVEDPKIIHSICGEVRFVTHPNKSFRACHKEHESIPDPITRNYPARFTLDKITDFAALPGMTASIEIDFTQFLATETSKAVYAPIEAVFTDEGKQWVWQVDKQMQARKLAITTGRIEGARIEILGEFPSDIQIITAGVSYVREGMLIKPIVKQRGL